MGLETHREWPDLCQDSLRKFLTDPKSHIQEWWRAAGIDNILKLIEANDLVCDGWCPLLAFLPPVELLKFRDRALKVGKSIHFLVTTRDTEEIIASELHHWVRHDLEDKTGLDDRSSLEALLRTRSINHANAVESFISYLRTAGGSNDLRRIITKLPLSEVKSWPLLVGGLSEDVCKSLEPLRNKMKLAEVFEDVGAQNKNPKLPVEGVLVTLRLSNGERLEQMLASLESDPLCQYLLVLALDDDEFDTSAARLLVSSLENRPRLTALHVIRNPTRTNQEPFSICQVWHTMARRAWEEGASWVVLLGDDVVIECTSHYRTIYRCFLDIKELGYPLWFGCPWFNDKTFQGFPTFPVVGRVHMDIFGGLIPKPRFKSFCNQDLDPYLQRLYLKFGAAPWMEKALLNNGAGGNETTPARYDRVAAKTPARYDRVAAKGWRDWVLDDLKPIQAYLESIEMTPKSKILLDVVVPSYRVPENALREICSLHVPEDMRTTFIIIVDNPNRLIELYGNVGATAAQASFALEQALRQNNRNNIRVRCNEENVGASASRNRGVEESSAEYILFLDDDIRPEKLLLEEYLFQMQKFIIDSQHEGQDREVVGLVGLVQFPRSESMPLKHAAVLMSYLTFMFEIADKKGMYEEPAWGVTANLLVKRVSGMHFDTDYAKTGGGEDVDYCLRLCENGGLLRAASNAKVHHEFWPGSVVDLSSHFYNWAIGDSALFERFPSHCYASFLNVVEMTFVLFVPWILCTGVEEIPQYMLMVTALVVADCTVDMVYLKDVAHRARLLKHPRSVGFIIGAHILANIYVIILETGRLRGHLSRMQLSNIGKRFDWHCGRLKNSRQNFRKKEMEKFILFLSVAIAFYPREKGALQGGTEAS